MLTTLGTGVADLCADPTNLIAKSRTAQHEISRALTNLGAVHQQAEMTRLDVLASRLQAAVHRFVQARLMASTARINTRLHLRIGSVSHGDISFRLV